MNIISYVKRLVSGELSENGRDPLMGVEGMSKSELEEMNLELGRQIDALREQRKRLKQLSEAK